MEGLGLTQRLAAFSKKNASFFEVATVVSVAELDSCELELHSGIKVSVPLRATKADNNKGVVIKPKVGSLVKILRTRGQIVITHYSEIEAVSCEIEGGFSIKNNKAALEIGEKFTLENDKHKLLDLLNELLGVIKTLKVSTPSGASGIPLPDVIQKLAGLETKFKELLN